MVNSATTVPSSPQAMRTGWMICSGSLSPSCTSISQKKVRPSRVRNSDRSAVRRRSSLPDLLSLVVGDLLDADGHRFDGRVVDASKIALHRSLPVPADLLFGRMHRRRF